MINIDNNSEEILSQLLGFVNNRKVPNLLFYGPCKSGKKTLLKRLLQEIYANNREKMSTYLKIVNCAHTNGIQFVRDDLKLFSKMNLHYTEDLFKSVVLLNADKLTIDSQSAIRRLIEVSNHSTRFFIVVEDKNKMLKPILSRFCEFYISRTSDFSSTQPNFFSFPFCQIWEEEEEVKKNEEDKKEEEKEEKEEEKKENDQREKEEKNNTRKEENEEIMKEKKKINERCLMWKKFHELLEEENSNHHFSSEKQPLSSAFLTILLNFSNELYENGCCAIELMYSLEFTQEKEIFMIHDVLGYSYLCLVLHRLKKEIKNEVYLIYSLFLLSAQFFHLEANEFRNYAKNILISLLI